MDLKDFNIFEIDSQGPKGIPNRLQRIRKDSEKSFKNHSKVISKTTPKRFTKDSEIDPKRDSQKILDGFERIQKESNMLQ